MNRNYIIVFILAVAVIGILFVFNKEKSSLTNISSNGSEITSVNAVEFARLAERDDSFLLDVHIPEQEHIPGTDAFIPYNEIEKNRDKLPEDKNTQILVYCRSGSMSREAAVELHNLGFSNVVDLEGGINAYKEANVKVEMTPTSRDLGTVIYGDIATTEFTLTNFTSQELNITKVATSCGCTSAEVEKTTLAAYESTTVKVSFDPAVHKDDTDLGDITRTIYINTDNPNFKQITAVITAKVVKK